ncbi:MAG: Ig-like domain-containing protein, partial [Methanobrevibacter sp.]|nr:Ig-like domain-containing protein [Methanobrevibacter sp.]
LINKDANATLTENNVSGDEWAVYNNGTLTLSKNNFTSVIMNNGTILSKTVTRVLNNDTLVVNITDVAELNATIMDDNNNTIIPVNSFNLLADAINIDAVRDGKYLKGTYTCNERHIYIISAATTGLMDNHVETGILEVKVKSSIKLTVNQTNEGEKVVITAEINPNVAEGNVTFIINGEEQELQFISNGIATLTLTDVPAAYYYVTAKYNGDYLDYPSENQTSFIVKMRDPALSIVVNNILTGQTAVVNVTTNATGTVLIIVNGKPEEVEIKNGHAILNVTGLNNGTFNASVTYFGGNIFNRASNSTLFNVSEMSVKADSIPKGDDAVIIITIPKEITSGLTVYVNETPYITDIVYHNNGTATLTLPNLNLGTYEVNVTYTGDKYLYNEINGTTFTVTPATNYTFKVNITEGKYGENTTISVEIPTGISEVNVTIDGKTYPIVVDPTTGKGAYNISNLTAGDHKVTVSYAGDDQYAPKEIVKEITIPKAESKLNITVVNDGPGKNVTVTVDVGPNATGGVVVDVNGVKHYVEVDENGTATYVIPNAEPGDYNVTVSYAGDDNYAKVNNTYNFTVEKFDAKIIIKDPIVKDNNTVIVVIDIDPSDASGNVTVTLANGTNVTVPVKDGKAEVNVGILPVNGTMAYNVTYSGDKKYNGTTIVSDKNLTVGKLNNFTVDVEITEGQYGENTTVKVTVTPGVGGNVSVVVDNVTYPVKQDGEGNYIAIIPPLPLGNHNMTVKFENSSNYADKVINKNFTVEKNTDYDVIVNVTEGKYGENTTIEITAPKGIGVMNVTIDGVNYTVTINETTGKGVFNISNLTSGKHEVVTSFPGNDYYGPVSTNNIINVPKAESELNITVVNDGPGKNVTVTVDVGPNATGGVVVDVNGVKHYVEVDENGTATYVIPNAEPGDYNVTVSYAGDDNYAKVNNTYNFTVEKFDAKIIIKDPIVKDNNTVIVVIDIDPSDASGNVTVTLANGTNVTVPVKDGKAEVNVGILPVNGTMAYNVTYSGDKKYNGTTIVSDKNLTVGKLNNFTVDVEITEGQYGENTTVKVTVTPGVGGNVSVVVDNVTYPVKQDGEGNYIAIIPPLPLGNHNMTVKFENSSNYADKVVNKTFTVEKNDHYDLNITIIPTPTVFGNETIIDVTGPVGANVTVNVDGVNYTITINETGHGQKILDNLTAGPHKVVANFTGDDNYTGKVIEKTFDIEQAVPDIRVIVPEDIAPGSEANVTIVVGKNATGKVIVTIDGVPTVVNVTNGNATVPIPTNKPGDHNITVEYFGDGNYATPSTVTKANYTVDKYEAEIIIKDPIVKDNNTVIVVIEMNPSDADGNVTVTLADGTNVTVPVKDGKAEVNVGILPVNSTMAYNVTYSGNEKYNGTTIVSDKNLTVGKLNNFTVDMEIIEGQYGENTTVKVTVTPGVGGNVSVVVDNVTYPVTQDGEGNYIAIIPPSAVGTHNVTVKFENSSNYDDK